MKILLAAVVATVAVAVTAPAAHANRVPVDEGGDGAPCVVYAEYVVVQDAFLDHGVTRGQVRRVFDTDGHRTSTAAMDAMAAQTYVGHGHEVVVPVHRMVREYPVCVDAVTPNGGSVYVEFNLRTRRVVASLIS